jgi:hypothetical protein
MPVDSKRIYDETASESNRAGPTPAEVQPLRAWLPGTAESSYSKSTCGGGLVMYRSPDPRTEPQSRWRNDESIDRRGAPTRDKLRTTLATAGFVGLTIYLVAFPAIGMAVGAVSVVFAALIAGPLAVVSVGGADGLPPVRSSNHQIGAGQAERLTPPGVER